MAVATPNFDELGGLTYFALRFIEQLVAFSVPVFLFVSGFFIAFAAGRLSLKARWPLVGTRIKNLLIPYLIWSALIFVLNAAEQDVSTLRGYIEDLLTGGAADPYYYVPLLVQLLILSPFMLSWAKTSWKLLLVVTAVVQISIQILQYAYFLGADSAFFNSARILTSGWFFAGKVFWFALGMVVSLHLIPFKNWLEKIKRVLPFLLVFFLILGMVEWEIWLYLSPTPWIPYYDTALDNLYAITFIFFFVAHSKIKYPYDKQLSDLGTKSFGVYLIHTIVLAYTARIIYHVVPWILGHQIIFQPILWVMGLSIPLLLMAFVKRSPARKYYHYLFG